MTSTWLFSWKGRLFHLLIIEFCNLIKDSTVFSPFSFFLALAPQGSLRFMPPVTPTHWRGVRLANRFGAVCPQRLPSLSVPQPGVGISPSSYSSSSSSSSSSAGSSARSQVSGSADRRLPEQRLAALKRLISFLRNQSEDCLNLNVYVPHNPSNGEPPISFSFSLMGHLYY